MTPDEFVKLVAEMRAAQKEYFRTKSTSALAASIAKEKRVDAATAKFLSDLPGQSYMF